MNASQSRLQLKFRGSELNSDSCRLPGSNGLWSCETSVLARDSKIFPSVKFQTVLITMKVEVESLPTSPSSVVRCDTFSQKCQFFFKSPDISNSKHLKLGGEEFIHNFQATIQKKFHITELFEPIGY